MFFALTTLWHERSRFLPGLLAVAFSAVLIALQCGLLLGLFAITSIPIDHTRADIWLGSPRVPSVDLGRPIPDGFMSRLASLEGVERTEFFIQSFATWTKPGGGTALCVVVGSRLEDDALGRIDALTPEMRARLTEPNSVVIDTSELTNLGVEGVNDYAEINKHPVRIVGLVENIRSLAGPYIFCSESTARNLLRHLLPIHQSTYILGKVRPSADAEAIVSEINERYIDDMSAFTTRQFSWHTRKHWLIKTKAGVALGYAALLGLLVGMVVTSQTLYAATTASAREYAILLALGIPRWRVAMSVLVQSFYVGLVGVLLAGPSIYLLFEGAKYLDVYLTLPTWLLVGTSGITILMAVISGMLALRSVQKIEPMQLLR